MFHSLKLVSSDLDYINTPYQPIQVLRLIVHKKRFGIRYKVLIDIRCGYCFEWTSHFLINYIKSNLDYLDWHIISYSWLMTIWMSQMALWDFLKDPWWYLSRFIKTNVVDSSFFSVLYQNCHLQQWVNLYQHWCFR